MDKRSFIWFVVLAFLGMIVLQGAFSNPQTQAKVVEPTAVSFENVRITLEKESAAIAKLVFIKDTNGNVQQAQLHFKDEKRAPLLAQIPGEAGSLRLLAVAEKAGVETDAANQPVRQTSVLDGLIGMLGWILPMVIIFFVISFMMRGASKGMDIRGQIASTNAKQLVADKDKKTFKDVAGCDEAKEELQDVINYLRNPGLLGYLGGKPPKGVLLIGSPGNGKTLLAKAVAGEAEAAFFSISASQFVEMFVGVGAARVRDLFNSARQNKPAIVFIDEIDAVGRQRGTGFGGGHDEREQTLNQLLVEMDGFAAHDGVVVMAATNRPDVLDPALIRPGRFDLQVLVDSPDKHGRHEILKIHTRTKKLAADVDLDVIAVNTPGFSGAELEGLTDQAAIVAARRIEAASQELAKEKLSQEEISKRVPVSITMADMDEGIDRVQLGPAKNKAAKRMSKIDLENTAFHEIGHALVSQIMYEKGLGGDPVTKITIVPRARALGYTQALPKGDRFNYTKDNLTARIMMAMGGRAAQEIFLNTIDTGASNDFKQAWGWAHRMVTEFGMSELGPISIGEGGPNPFLGRSMASNHDLGPALANAIDDQTRKLVNECLEKTKALLKANERCMRKVAEVLLAKETILGPEFEALRASADCSEEKPCCAEEALKEDKEGGSQG